MMIQSVVDNDSLLEFVSSLVVVKERNEGDDDDGESRDRRQFKRESEVVVKMRLTRSLNCCLVCDFESMAVLLLHDFKTKPLIMFCCTS